MRLTLSELWRRGWGSLAEPLPLRLIALRALDAMFNVLSYDAKLNIGSIPRAQYGFGLLQAARLARRLGIPRISALEFGVAGGNGLLALEAHAAHVTRETGVEIAVYGFDSGGGLPPPVDYRDMPYAWEPGFYAMDVERLQAKLKHAKLIIGDVQETAARFGEHAPPPIGFVSFDLDYYSSTMAAFQIFELEDRLLLPRVYCYFDDVAGGAVLAYNEFTGELLAIKEFNAAHPNQKIARIAGLRHNFRTVPALWHEQTYVAHNFSHPQYNTPAHAGEDAGLVLKA